MFTDDIAGEIRRRSRVTEERGVLSAEVLERIYDLGLFKLFVPKDLGGSMTSLPEALRIFERSAWIDGNFGWSVAIGAGGGFFVNFMSSEVLPQVFGPRTAVIAGSGFPAGVARPEGDGFRVSGRWKYCSGSLYATTFTASARVFARDASSPQVLAFAFAPEQVKVVRDWRAFGLKGTASHSIQVDGVYVPRELTFDLTKPKNTYDDPLYRFPFLPFSEATFVAVVVGIGEHFLDEAKAVASKRVQASDGGGERDHHRSVLQRIDDACTRLEAVRRDFYERVDRSWDELLRRRGVPEELQEALSQQSKRAAAAVVECANAVFAYLGMEAIMEESALNQAYRDLVTARQHKLLVPLT